MDAVADAVVDAVADAVADAVVDAGADAVTDAVVGDGMLNSSGDFVAADKEAADVVVLLHQSLDSVHP